MFTSFPIFVFVASAVLRFFWRSRQAVGPAYLPHSKKPVLTLKTLHALRKLSAHP